jgi:ABC-type sugar transport system ATPase subunit
MSTVKLENISKVFDGGVEALCDVSITANQGECLVLAGPSGGGKTTILRLIAGLETPTSGRILIDGEDITNIKARDRNVAMVFQHFSLYPHMTVFENMGFALKMQKLNKKIIRDKVFQTAEMLEIEQLLERKPWQLSGGQRQRAALGKAIVRQARVFLFDEPLSNLDHMLRAKARKQIKDILKRLKATSIYVTHDRNEAKELADSICILDSGKVQQIGAIDEVVSKPANEFVSSFICDTPI